MAARRQQRLVNLVLLLLSTRQFVTADRIRDTVEGYEVAPDAANPEEAFKRSFERDKAELRELGIPLETGRNSVFDTEDGYRIAREDFELPPITLSADEAAAVGLAARLWSTASLAGEARTALMKLRAAGVEIGEPPGSEAIPPLPAGEPALPDLLSAVAEHRVVQFRHRKGGAAHAERRTIEPWGVLSWRGRWYLVGHDRDREDVRSFRVDRIEGPVVITAERAATNRPEQLDMVALVRGAHAVPGHAAELLLRRGRAGQLRRLGSPLPGQAPPTDWDRVAVQYRDTDWLAGLVAAAGPDAVAVAPPELVQATVRLLAAAAGRPLAERSAS